MDGFFPVIDFVDNPWGENLCSRQFFTRLTSEEEEIAVTSEVKTTSTFTTFKYPGAYAEGGRDRTAAAPGLKVGDQAPPFSLVGSDGRTYDLAAYRGRQAVVLAWIVKAFSEP